MIVQLYFIYLIDISATPTFTITPDPPVFGQPLVFTCQRGLQNYKISKDFEVMSTSETYTIPAVALSDVGLWTCLAENSGHYLLSLPVNVPKTGEYSQWLYQGVSTAIYRIKL